MGSLRINTDGHRDPSLPHFIRSHLSLQGSLSACSHLFLVNNKKALIYLTGNAQHLVHTGDAIAGQLQSAVGQAHETWLFLGQGRKPCAVIAAQGIGKIKIDLQQFKDTYPATVTGIVAGRAATPFSESNCITG